jgi:flagellar motor switch protein FliM
MKRELTQQEIDAVFQRTGEAHHESRLAVIPFDFNRFDRVPKSQIRAVHLLHEEFSRNTSSSLSAYLRAHIELNLVSLEQISYAEFQEGLASPTFIALVGLRPYEGIAALEISPVLVFSFVEMLLGGDGKVPVTMQRKATEIEKNLMRNLLRIILQDLSEAWKSVTDIRFAVQTLADEPQGLNIFSPGESIVSIGFEVGVGSVTGMINFALPSLFIKRLRHMFERLRRVQPAESKSRDQAHMAKMLKSVDLSFEARLDGMTISPRHLLGLEVGNVLTLGAALDTKMKGLLNGKPKFSGDIVITGEKLGFQIESTVRPEEISL